MDSWLPLAVVALVVAAAVAGWLLVARPHRPSVEGSSAPLIDELRRQLASADERLAGARDRLTSAEALRGAAEARLEEHRRADAERAGTYAEATQQLRDTFKALAADALSSNREELVKSAEALLKGMNDRGDAARASQRESMEQLVTPLREVLDSYKRETAELEQARLKQLGTVEEQYRDLSTAAASLRDETSKLSTALRSPHVRGRWGQLTLRRTAELAGMAKHCDFYEEVTVPTEGKRLRPDMVVRLPSHRLVVVDSKVPLDGYLDATGGATDAVRDDALLRHARQAREHVVQLSTKDYQSEFEQTPDFVVAFIPNDAILAAAVDKDPDLVEFAFSRGVVIATPSTLFALLKTIEYGWRQEQIAENAQQVNRLAQQLAERLGVMADHFDKVGGALRRAVEAYNASVSSLESRVLPSARRFRALGVSSRLIPEIPQIEIAPRSILPSTAGTSDELFPDADVESEAEDGAEGLAEPGPRLQIPGCRVCGREFEGSGLDARYCSDTCRERGKVVEAGARSPGGE